jgi:hypothetical protein
MENGQVVVCAATKLLGYAQDRGVIHVVIPPSAVGGRLPLLKEVYDCEIEFMGVHDQSWPINLVTKATFVGGVK